MEFDILLRGGTLVDGTGKTPAYRADLGIRQGRITAIGNLEGAAAGRVVDATGKVVSPGFIDVHIHSELALLGGEHRYGALYQGVTTHLTAPDGFGWAPLSRAQAEDLYRATYPIYGEPPFPLGWGSAREFLDEFNGRTPANLVPQIPHCAVRYAAMGWSDQPAGPDELKQMEAITREWLEAGAVCLNVGLDYQPAMFSTTDELVYLSKVALEYDAVYAAHIRNTKIGSENAWKETFEISRRSGIPVHFSHSQVTPITRPLMEANADVDWSFESYLYPASCTHLVMTLPPWAQQGGNDRIEARMVEPGMRDRLLPEWQKRLDARVGHPEILVTGSGRYIGRTLNEAAAEKGVSTAEFAYELLLEEHQDVLMRYPWGGDEAANEQIMTETARHPRMMAASDGIYRSPHGHPRGYGCFARVLGYWWRQKRAITLEEAVWKLAGFPAERFRIKDRGRLAEGLAADVVVFDPDRVIDRATWTEPFRPAEGVDLVIVNGEPVLEGAVPTGKLPGKVLGRR